MALKVDTFITKKIVIGYCKISFFVSSFIISIKYFINEGILLLIGYNWLSNCN